MLSFSPIGMPCNGPRRWPRASSASSARACASASSASHRDIGVDCAVDALDALEIRARELDGRQVARGDAAARFFDRESREVVVARVAPSRVRRREHRRRRGACHQAAARDRVFDRHCCSPRCLDAENSPARAFVTMARPFDYGDRPMMYCGWRSAERSAAWRVMPSRSAPRAGSARHFRGARCSSTSRARSRSGCSRRSLTADGRPLLGSRCARVRDGRRARRLHDVLVVQPRDADARARRRARRGRARTSRYRSCCASPACGSASRRRRFSIAERFSFAAPTRLPVNCAAERCRSGRTGLTRNQVCE